MKTIIQYLKKGIIPSSIINFIWHFTSPSHVSLLEQLMGWGLVWLVISVAIWSWFGIKEKIKPFAISMFNDYSKQFNNPQF